MLHYYCDYHSYSRGNCHELSMLEFNKAIHPFTLVSFIISNNVEKCLDVLYKAGSHCADQTIKVVSIHTPIQQKHRTGKDDSF